MLDGRESVTFELRSGHGEHGCTGLGREDVAQAKRARGDSERAAQCSDFAEPPAAWGVGLAYASRETPWEAVTISAVARHAMCSTGSIGGGPRACSIEGEPRGAASSFGP